MIDFGVYMIFQINVKPHQVLIRNTVLKQLHGPPMLVDKTSFGFVLYDRANVYRLEETSSY